MPSVNMPRAFFIMPEIAKNRPQGNTGYEQYNGNSLGTLGENFAGSPLDPFGDVSGFYNDIMGFTEQDRQFAQQEYLMDKENAYNHPAAQMQRMKEAGISAYAAAAGIAGNGSASAAPSSVGSASPAADPLSAAGKAGELSQSAAVNKSAAEKNLADAEQAKSVARNADRLADAEVLNKAGNFAKALTESGTAEIDAMVLGISVVSGGLAGIMAAFKGDGICRMIETKQAAIEAEYSKTWKEIELAEKQLQLQPLLYSEQEKKNLLLDIEQRKQTAIAQREQQLTQMWQEYKGDPFLDLYQRQYQLLHDYGADSPQYKSFIAECKNLSYNQAYGTTQAESEFAYQIAIARRNGDNQSDLIYKRCGSWADAIGKASNIIGYHLENVQNGVIKGIDNLSNSGKASAIRKELSMILNNAYEQLEKYPDDSERINEVISTMSAALQLDNRSLVDWYNRTNQ